MSVAQRVTTPRSTVSTAVRWRAALALNALVAAVGLVVKIGDSATATDPRFSNVVGRVADELCYFTIQSNLIVLAVCALLAWRPDRWSWLAGAPRLVGLVCISVTGVVYYALLASDQDFEGLAKVADVLAHAVSPLMFVGTWLFLGPRGHLRYRHIAHLSVFVAMWVALTLVRGAITDIYPYDFVDVRANGYVSVIVTILAMTSAAVVLAAAAVWFDRRLSAD